MEPPAVESVRLAAPADLPVIREVVTAAYARYLDRMDRPPAPMQFAEEQARQRGLTRLDLYTNEVMTENQAIYARLGYRETARRTEDGYRRVYLEKHLR
jgi:hypothetical protein